MSTVTTSAEVARYLEEVRRHLADLPEEERDGLVEDLDDHLAEVVAEHGLPLERRLGEPAAFAAELRASAGLDGPSGAAGQRRGPARTLVSSVRGSVAASPTVRRVREFLPELRPGWWVLRGYVAVAVLAVLDSGREAMRTFPVPGLAGSALLGILAVALTVPASVALGRQAAESGRRRWLDRVASGLVVLGCLLGLGAVQAGSPVEWHPAVGHLPGGDHLHDAAGRPISNIYAYDQDGKLLDTVYLYDQAGRPLSDVAPVTEDGQPVERNYRLDANGAPIVNAYPLDVLVVEPWAGPGYPRRTQPMRPPVVVVPPTTAG